MKFSAITSILFAATALAAPAPAPQSSDDYSGLIKRCKGTMMAYARGSTELGNVGTLGPDLKSGLNRNLNRDFALQGIEYAADLASNFLEKGTSDRAIREMVSVLTEMAEDCPNAKLVVGGYSQGSAVAVWGIQGVSQSIRDRIVAAVLFGYTKNQQYGARIPNFPLEKTAIYCNNGDLVCSGTLTITAAHLTYGSTAVPAAVNFITQRVNSS